MRKLFSLILLIGAAFQVAHADIPTEDFFRHAEFGDAAISPTGQYMAVAVPDEDRRNLAVIDISDPAAMQVTAAYELSQGENVANVRWVSEDRLIFGSTIQVGSEHQPQLTGRIFGINADGSNRRFLFGPRGDSFVARRMSIIHMLPEDPDWILIESWAHDRPKPRAQMLNVVDGRVRGYATSPLNRGNLLADQEGEVRFAYGTNDEDDPVFAWRENGESDWKEFANEFGSYIEPIAFDNEGEGIYFSSDISGQLGVFHVELQSGAITPVVESDRVHIPRSGIMLSREARSIVAVEVPDGRPEWTIIDPDSFEAQWLAQLQSMFADNRVRIYNWTQDGTRAMVSVSSDRAPAEFFLLNTETPELRFVAGSRPWVDPQQMAAQKPVQFEARDGLEIPGYLTLPPDYTEGEAIPFVVYIHGGPHGIRDSWGFDGRIQFFAHHGFGVLQINYRGSGGYGREFEEAGYLEWGAKMQDDITDGTLWAIEQGYADPDATCIAGASYGGYSTLSGITREPDLYACAWAFVGVYDMPLMKEEGNIPSFEAGRRYLDRVLGTDEQVLRERSPTNHVSKIETPLFIAHGAEDRQAHVGQYHLLKEKLDEAGITYEELLVENEGHGFYKVENNVLMMDRVIEFMKEHTGQE